MDLAKPHSAQSVQPDVMNDPAYETNPEGGVEKGKGKSKGPEEPDTCRICRGEGSREEPLFYPCKCSGSIKFVHQVCLMEWLSHSQKKHCELCKTSFRFTKLYDPHMPSTVPLGVFIRQATVHTLKSLLTWIRWNLVIFVWLAWVPWCMRTVWRGLFWVGDGGWITRQDIERHSAYLEKLAAESSNPANGTSSWQAENTTSALLSMASSVVGLVPDIIVGEPTVLWLGKRLIRSLLPSVTITLSNVVTNTTSPIKTADRSPSLLSDFAFFRKLTRWDRLNNTVIDVLEGQLITLFVVVSFILIFLIREWVVQQQPAINIGAAINVEAAVADARNRAEGQQGAEPQQAEQQDDDDNEQIADEQDSQAEEVERSLELPVEAESHEQHGAILVPVSRHDNAATQDSTGNLLRDFEPDPDQNGEETSRTSRVPEDTLPPFAHAEAVSTNGSQRPTMPAREVVARASEIQRTLQEQSIASGLAGLASTDSIEVPVTSVLESESNTHNDEVPSEQASQGSNGSWQVVEELPAKSPTSLVSQTEAPNQLTMDDELSETISRPTAGSDVVEDQVQDSRMVYPEEQTIPEPDTGTGDHDEHPLDDDGTSERLLAENPNEADDDVSVASSSEFEEFPAPAPGINPRRRPALPAGLVRDERQHNIADAVGEWLWGEVPEVDAAPEEPEEDDEHVVQDVADEAPFVPVAQGQLVVRAENAPEVGAPADPEVLQAAAEAGVDPGDPEAVEDGEDLEGVMELIGMQGPLAGLVQNGMFSAVLISLSVFFGIWIPYITGKLVLVFLANPVSLLFKMPLKWVSATADMIIDLSIFLLGYCFYWVDAAVRLIVIPVGWIFPLAREANKDRYIPLAAYKFTRSAAERLARGFVATSTHFSDSDIPVFSILAHESLNSIQTRVIHGFGTVFGTLHTIAEAHSNNTLSLRSSKHALWLVTLKLQQLLSLAFAAAWDWVTVDLVYLVKNYNLISLARNPNFHVNLEIPRRTTPIDYNLAQWSIKDRVFAILLGYIFFSFAGAAYLRIRSALRDEQESERSDGLLVDVLHQAGGVMKVILIITIEMIIFPLYCGMLLDVALLPLFGGATVLSRILFTASSPATSLFIHWFVGTCYMFHFALFVSMCRKIMRAGVLCKSDAKKCRVKLNTMTDFIRDPDDPAFHPVRDVLERNIYTQLRKIAFSALVYGALVIICLGTVVWGLSSVVPGVFPIHWSSNEPILPFPVDLLIYNFLMPGVLKIFKPSAGLKVMYRWWFRKCARALRLTHFLFNERKEDEEGRRTWQQIQDDSVPRMQLEETSVDTDGLQEQDRPFVRDGRFVRAPASDQVRIPKGERTFVEVDEEGNRTDGLPDNDQGLHGRKNKLFSQVYIPPHFRLRIGAFIILLWLFAATTGVGFTVIPLLFGRRVFTYLAPSHLRMNDVYAFAIGSYILGSPLYLGVRYRATLSSHFPANAALQSYRLTTFVTHALRIVFRAIRLLYFYGAFTLFLPSLVALLFEAYLNIPLNTYLTGGNPLHTIHFITDWTLGVLYIKLAAKILSFYPNSRPAQALRALVSPRNNGSSWLDPDVRLATRAFILPSAIFTAVALIAPLGLGWAINASRFGNAEEVSRAIIFRYSYPAVFFLGMALVSGRVLWKAVTTWRRKIRDEVYLIGERLHNFGEKRPLVSRVATRA